MSKSSIDALGDRLRSQLSDDDLRQLDQFRRSFAGAYEVVISFVRSLGLDPTGRPAKSTSSMVAKLKRETIRLSQMQDIAGCRVVVPDVPIQDQVVSNLSKLFSRVVTHDRRQNPSHGYRAVHLVVTLDDRAVEVQIRTEIQHLWAELSEKLSDVAGSEIKYGLGDTETLNMLRETSELIAVIEAWEVRSLPAKLVEVKQRLHAIMQTTIRGLSGNTGG